MTGVVRIIGGLYRGKKINFPSVEGLRPTPNRIRETLFNWLMHDIQDARCLDAFAGSGALGFEALSRGAKEVVMLETSKPAFAALERNVASFPADIPLSLLQMDAFTYFRKDQKPFDLIFLDPPFQKKYLSECFKMITENHCLSLGGFIYVESPEKIIPDEESFALKKSKKAGDVHYALFEKLDKQPCSCSNGITSID